MDIKDQKEDLIFQVSDWASYHEEESVADQDEPQKKYTIRLYGTTKIGEKIYVRVDGFEPFFYVKIPLHWKTQKASVFVETLRRKVYPFHFKSTLKTWKIVKKCEFKEFTNYTKFKFLKLIFHSHDGLRKFSWLLDKKIDNQFLSARPQKYQKYESNLEPYLRCMHMRDIKPTGWVKISKYTHFHKSERPSYNKINIHTRWTNLDPVEDNSIAPFIIASFDIECVSEDSGFPQPHRDNDKIIQIGASFNHYGNAECYHKYIATLDTCDLIPNTTVESFKTEQDLLLGWARYMRKINADIMTGYNIFGFDYRYIEARSKKLSINNKFLKLLGRLRNEPSVFIEKELSSSALGQNKLLYYNMPGIVQIDLMKVIMRDHNLSSYKLDDVAAEFIRETIKGVREIKTDDKIQTIIDTKSTYGLEIGRYIKIYFNDGLSDNAYKDNAKFKIINLEKDTITIDGILDGEAIQLDTYKVFWCQAKDDVKVQDIFDCQKGTSKDRAVIAKYCVQDCILCNKLLEKLQITTNNISMSNVCYVPLSFIFLRGQGVKIFSLMAKKCREKGHLIPYHKIKQKDPTKTPTGSEEEDNEGYEGATVLRPDKGVYFTPTAVLDYASLYPSSMIHRNLSHECLVLDDKYDGLPDYKYYTTTYYNKDGSSTTCKWAKRLDGKMGIVPEVLRDLLAARKATKKLLKVEKDSQKKNILDGLQLAFKLTANSLYGQTGAPTSAIYCKPVAASTTATGREMLNGARLFTEFIFAKIVRVILKGDYSRYTKLMRFLFEKKIDLLLGTKIIEKLKDSYYKDNEDPNDTSHLHKANDYYYLRIFQEKSKKLEDKDFIDEKLGITGKSSFMKYFYDEIRKVLLDGDLSIEPYCVYGDSVTGDTPLMIKSNDKVTIRTIDSLTSDWKSYQLFKVLDFNSTRCEKQQNNNPTNFQVWTDDGWSLIKRVIRHKCKKKIFRISTHTSIVDVTEDHSLLDKDGNIIRPTECKVGTELLRSFPDINKTRKHQLSKYKAYLYGFFMGVGSYKVNDSKYGTTYSWVLDNANKYLLEKLKVKLNKIYPDNNFRIIEILESSVVYKLISSSNKQCLVDEYKDKFYDRDNNKIIPTEILNGSSRDRKSYLKGLLDAGGCRQYTKKSNYTILYAKGKITAMNIFYLLKSINYNVLLDTRKENPDIFKFTYSLRASKNRSYTEKIKKIEDLGYLPDDQFVYDLETDSGHFNAGVGEITVKNTDSIFVNYKIQHYKDKEPLTDHLSLKTAIRLGVLCGDLINYVMPEPQNLEYEKTFWPWVILTKKRYVGNLYEFDPNSFVQKSMGIVLKRRDNSPIVKIVVGGIVKCILNERSSEKAVKFTDETLRKIFQGEYQIEKFIISKTLRADYKNRTGQAHAVLADRITERNPGNKPQTNDRIPYVYIEVDKKVKLQGDRVESPDYILENKLKIDYLYYIIKQIMKPSLQFLEHIVPGDPTKLFTKHITIATNNKKGIRPIEYWMNHNKDDSKSKNKEEISKISCLDDIIITPSEKPKLKAKQKKKPTNQLIDKPLFNNKKGGYVIDL